jgi:hypothetical protein
LKHDSHNGLGFLVNIAAPKAIAAPEAIADLGVYCIHIDRCDQKNQVAAYQRQIRSQKGLKSNLALGPIASLRAITALGAIAAFTAS